MPFSWKTLAAGALSGAAGALAILEYQSLRTALVRDAAPDVDEEATSTLAQRFGVPTAAATVLMGAALGTVYAALGEKYPVTRAGAGSAFGAAAWLIGDELVAPAMGLVQNANSISGHASALAGHLVFGVTTECVRQLLSEAR
jgi:uncharacterized BrkB/YihY/UPF0761 family membrane protein